MHPLSNKWVGLVHLPHGRDFVPWIGHLIENEHFWTVLAWAILILTFMFFATVPAY